MGHKQHMMFTLPQPMTLQLSYLCQRHSLPGFITSSPLPLTPTGDDCSLSSSDLPSSIKDNFESGSASQESWQLIQGGGVGSGCGQLSPHAHGDSLYFNGCKMRQAVTKPLDLTRARYRYYQNTLSFIQIWKRSSGIITASVSFSAHNQPLMNSFSLFSPPSSPSARSKIMFVLQIGSVAQTDSCNIALDQADTVDRAVLLQYSVNNGVSWHVIAQHQPKDFIKAQRISYNIPL